MTISNSSLPERDGEREPSLAELYARLAALRENLRRARERYGLPVAIASDEMKV